MRLLWFLFHLATQGASTTSPFVWSPRGDAVAFASRDRTGHPSLVVLLAHGPPLTWRLPEPARAVAWLGPTRVGAGPSELTPRMVASWTTQLR
jgi:hypothetical protein